MDRFKYAVGDCNDNQFPSEDLPDDTSI